MRAARGLTVLAFSLAPAVTVAEPAPAPAPAQADAPACVKHRSEARYRNLGYDHLVHLRNTCDRPVVCHVSTNVNPEPTEVGLRPSEERQVLTWRGSPAREFTARVACRLAR